MNLKTHYKIIISIIIVIILLSSLIIYYYPHHNTVYHNNGESVDVKYFHNEYPLYIFNANYSASSYSIGNRESYLNTTLTDLNYVSSPPTSAGIDSHINISMKNINARYVYITTTGSNNDQYVQITGTHTPINCKQEGNKWINKYSSFENLHSMGINFGIPSFYLHNGNYNFTLTISAGKLDNTFNIHAEKESAIYGSIQNYSTGNIVNVNTTLYIENMNNSIINPINVRDGYYYYFVNPYTEYKLYLLNNNTLKLIDTISNKNITSGNSYRNVIFSDEL